MTTIERFKTPEVKNWVKGMLALNVTRKALRYIIEHKWEIFQNSELTAEEMTYMETFIVCLQDNKVKSLKTNLRHMTCGHPNCEKILNRLLKFRNFTIEPFKTDLEEIAEMTGQNKAEQEESDAFKEEENCGSKETTTEQIESFPSYMLDIAKLYVYTDSDMVMESSLVELDISILVELMNRCKLFSFSRSEEMFNDILDRRNMWVHSSSYQFSSEETVTFINSLKKLLENYACCNIYQCSDAVADLRHLRDMNVYNEYNETEYMHMLKTAMEIQETSLDRDISSCQMTCTNQNTLGDLLKSTSAVLEEINGCLAKPSVTEVEMESVTLTWDQSRKLRDTEYFEIHFREKTVCEWSIYPEKHRNTTAVLENLKPGATYRFRIKIVDETEIYSPESEEITMLQSQAGELVKEAKKLNVSLAIYLLPLTKIMQNNKTKTIKYLVGAGNKQEGRNRNPYEMPFGPDKQEKQGIEFETTSCKANSDQSAPASSSSTQTKTIIIFGGAGSGRFELVDSIVNYVLGVRWNDYFLLTVDDKEFNFWNRTFQEEWIKCYTLNPEKGNRLTYQLQVIVIPGFSYMHDASENKIRQIRQLFVEMSAEGYLCHATICLVLRTKWQKPSFQHEKMWHLIRSLLGEHLRPNECTFLLGDGFSVYRTAFAGTIFENCFSIYPLSSFERYMTGYKERLLKPYWNEHGKALSGFFGFVEQVPPCTLQSTLAILDERISKMELEETERKREREAARLREQGEAARLREQGEAARQGEQRGKWYCPVQ